MQVPCQVITFVYMAESSGKKPIPKHAETHSCLKFLTESARAAFMDLRLNVNRATHMIKKTKLAIPITSFSTLIRGYSF
jgi:hypothetical protein